MIEAASAMRIVTFRLGRELFAADILSVERVLRYEPPRAIPNVPDWIEGVFEYEGRVVPVVDLRRRFGLAEPDAAATAPARVLVFSAAGDWVAVIVDAVLDVRPMNPAELVAPPRLFRGLSAEYLRGLIRRDGQLVVVLDVDRLLSADEHLALHAVAETQ